MIMEMDGSRQKAEVRHDVNVIDTAWAECLLNSITDTEKKGKKRIPCFFLKQEERDEYLIESEPCSARVEDLVV